MVQNNLQDQTQAGDLDFSAKLGSISDDTLDSQWDGLKKTEIKPNDDCVADIQASADGSLDNQAMENCEIPLPPNQSVLGE